MRALQGTNGHRTSAGKSIGGYPLLFERNPQPMWVEDAATHDLLAVNEAALARYRCSRSEFLALSAGDLRTSENGSGRQVEPDATQHGEPTEADLICDPVLFDGRRATLVLVPEVASQRRAEEELARRARQQAAVAELGAEALEGMEIGSLFDAVAKLVVETLDVEMSEVLELNEQREGFVLQAGVGWQPGLVRRAVVPMSSSFYTGFAWSSRGATIVEDYEAESRFQRTGVAAEHEVVGSASVIIGRRGHPFGLLSALSTERHKFASDDVNFLKALANVLANAIQRKAAEESIRHQALHDPLTGLPNRTLLLDRLAHWGERADRSGGRAGVIFIDLDLFKLVNDALGHEGGDEVLVEATQRMHQAMRPMDTLARVGGDEFVLLCEDIASEPDALKIVERLLAAFEEPFKVAGAERQLSASIGIVLGPAGSSPTDLLRDADAAMYSAKEQGGGRFELFDEAMRERSAQWSRTESELRQGLQRGELFNAYQPIVSLATGVIGFEALVRWTHPERGQVLPGEFIPVAEQSGLIVPLGRSVLEEACRAAVSWPSVREDAPAPIVTVNLSPRQVASPGLVESVAEVLAETGLDPSRLKLEITEMVLIRNTERALDTLKELKSLGVGLILDDFGTGYSSLGYVKRFPIDVLKIDRSFINGMSRDSQNSAIVSAVLSMGEALGLEVVAEGVETCDQARQLESLGCRLAQGFLFARPDTAEAAANLLLAQAERDSARN